MKGFRVKLALLAAAVTFGFGGSSAYAGFVTADAQFTGIEDVRMTGTATVDFLGFGGLELFEATGLTTDGIADAFNDGQFFDSQTSMFGEGTATNGGSGDSINSQSFVEAEQNSLSSAFTFIDTALEFSGLGTIEIDIGFDLFVEGFDNRPSAFANASVFAFGSSVDTEEAVLALADATGFGSSDNLVGFLTLVFDVDDFGFGPYTEILTVGTEANAQAVATPAALWLLAPGLLVALFRRRSASRVRGSVG